MTGNSNPDSNVAFSPQIITAQLDLILSSDTFADVPRLRQFLGYVVNETLNGRSAHIKDFAISKDVFQRKGSFDEQDSTIVHDETGRLRQHLKDYYLTEGQNDPIHIRIPKEGYIPLFDEITPGLEQNAAGRPVAEPLHSRRQHFTSTGILGFIIIMFTLFALFRIFNLLGYETI